MILTKIHVNNFRNINDLDLYLNKNINIFIGDNAQGKTNILESIYTLAITKSHRGIRDVDLINHDSDFSKISGFLQNNHTINNYEIVLTKSSKKIKKDGLEIQKVSDYISNINVIMFTPDDLEIIKKSPSVRRNLINIELCQLYVEYTRVLNEYNKILRMRNEYLRKSYNFINFDYFDILTLNLASRAFIIKKYRSSFFKKINLVIDDIFFKISGVSGLSVVYNDSLSDLNSIDEINAFLKSSYDNEINQKVSLYGPHRDDFSFYLNGMDLKKYGSQGQQRLAVLSLKLSEISVFKDIVGTNPIVLLDDIFSEIDLTKRKKLLKFLKSDIQFIITTTDINNINKDLIDKASIFKVNDGSVKQNEKD